MDKNGDGHLDFDELHEARCVESRPLEIEG